MTNAHEPDREFDDLSLENACQRALEEWVCDGHGDPAGRLPHEHPSLEHISGCEVCRGLAEAIAFDQQLLRWQLSRIEPPPAPVLPLREPLRAASGHPRRISLTVIPFLLAVLLVIVLAVQYMLGSIGQEQRGQRIRTSRNTLEQVASAAATALAPPRSPTDLPPSDWPARLGDAAALAPGTAEGATVPTDGFGRAIRLRASDDGTRWIAVSAGADGVFAADSPSTDDLTSDDPPTDD